LSPKNGPLGQRSGPDKDGQNNAKSALLVTFPPEKLKPKTKKFFSILTTRLAESVEGLNSSLAQITWRVIGLQCSAKKVAHVGLKGLNCHEQYMKYKISMTKSLHLEFP